MVTHDPRLLEGVAGGWTPGEGWSRVEFQMMYGVRRDLQGRFAGRGYPVRVYIPYGTEWYPYLIVGSPSGRPTCGSSFRTC